MLLCNLGRCGFHGSGYFFVSLNLVHHRLVRYRRFLNTRKGTGNGRGFPRHNSLRLNRLRFMDTGMRSCRTLVRGTAIARDGLSRQQAVAIPFEGRFDQSRRLCQNNIRPRCRTTAFHRLRGSPDSGLATVFGEGLPWQGKGNGSYRTSLDRLGFRFILPLPFPFPFDDWFYRPRSLRAAGSSRLLTRLLLPALRWTKTLAAAAAPAPTPGSIFKLTARRRRGSAIYRRAIAFRLFFGAFDCGARLLRCAARSSRFLAVRRNALKVGRVFLLLHKIGDVQKSIPLQS
jgi:hypothetical protein